MGEAKRRKQALGDRYGKTPPVLMPDSEQLEEHATKFINAYFAQFDKLNTTDPEDDKLEQEAIDPDSNQQQDTQIQAMQQWVQDYFEPYRPKDREQLVISLLEPFYFVLFEAPPEFFKEQPVDEKTEYIASLAGGLTSLSILRSYLSEPRLEEHLEPMRSLYWDMLYNLEEEELDEDDLSSKAGQLTRLFQSCLDEEDIPEYVSL